MKKKTIFTALTATLSAVMVSGSLVTPAYATENNIIAGTMVNGNAIYGTCQYCGLEITTVMDTYAYGNLKSHETTCLKNPDRKGGQSTAKEEIEIFIPTLVCETCGEEYFPIDEELHKHEENKDDSGISTHAESTAKEEIEIGIEPPKCPDCGEEFPEDDHECHKSEVPNYAPSYELPEAEIGIVPDYAPSYDLPEAEFGVVPNDAPSYTLPEAEFGVVPNDAPSYTLPEAEFGVVPNDAPSYELPELIIKETTTTKEGHSKSAKEEIELVIEIWEEIPEKPNTSGGAQSTAKEEIEIDIPTIKCEICGEEYLPIDEELHRHE